MFISHSQNHSRGPCCAGHLQRLLPNIAAPLPLLLPLLARRVVYGDRDVQATLQRLSQNMDLQQLLQMATGRGLPEPPAVSSRPGTGHFWRLVADQRAMSHHDGVGRASSAGHSELCICC